VTLRIAVVAHQGKSFDGGLPRLRQLLTSAGVDDPIWLEVPKSKRAPKSVHQALDAGATRLLLWGGDGMVQRCIDALAGIDAPPPIAILPAGTANLLATSLDVPNSLEAAVRIALAGRVREIDAGNVNGERFAVMSGVGFDAEMIAAADGKAKRTFGQFAYVRTGVGAMRAPPMAIQVDLDGKRWFAGKASCLLVGNVGVASGGLVVFKDAAIDDGLLEVGVVTATGAREWLRVFARAIRRNADASGFVHLARARKVDVRLKDKRRYEVDGGSRTKVRHLRYEVETGAVRVLVPA
jgi:YegS/Rv2252/BmrU family lipid kinase